MRMNIAELSLQMMLLLPVSFVSAAAVSYFVPRAGAVEIEADGMAQMDAGEYDTVPPLCREKTLCL